MASPALAARLGAAMKAETDVGDVAAPQDNEAADDVVETVEVANDTEAAPSEPANDNETPEQVDTKLRAARHALLEEKLKGAREKRQAQRLAEQAKADRKAAAAERETAAAEKAKYAGLKEGSFKDTLKALGRDPREAWEEMNREAIEGSTPEAQAKRAEEKRQKEIEDKFTPIQEELRQLREERVQWQAQQEHTRVVTNFQRSLADPTFTELRVEYPDEVLFEHAQHYVSHPDDLYAAADQFSVQLTDRSKGFTMHELLQVLSAAQAAHNAGVQARRAAQRPAAAQAGKPPTVNGTAERRNAGTANGIDLASPRATAKAEVSTLSPRERMRQRVSEEIRKGSR